MDFKVLVLVTPLLFSGTGSIGKANCDQPEQKKAYLIRTQLAGVEMNVDQKDFIWFDKTSGYYLAKTGSNWEHFGANYILTPNRKAIPFFNNSATKTQAFPAKFPRLKNGSGINIGDTIAQVHRKLGTEAEYSYHEHNLPQKTEVYFGCTKLKTPQKTGQPKLKTYIYRAQYTFFNGQLKIIEYNLSSPDTRA